MEQEKVPHGRIHRPEEGEELPCDVCGLWYPDEPSSTDIHVMTKRELKILDAMREVKQGAKGVRDRMRSIIAEDEQGAELQQRLKELQARWRELDAEREAAAEERMKMLGHQSS
jgi:DNA repair exonuclease SbcCD ATPase subunit